MQREPPPRAGSTGQWCTSQIIIYTHYKREGCSDAKEWENPSIWKYVIWIILLIFEWFLLIIDNFLAFCLTLVICKMVMIEMIFPYNDPNVFLKIKNKIKLWSTLSSTKQSRTGTREHIMHIDRWHSLLVSVRSARPANCCVIL